VSLARGAAALLLLLACAGCFQSRYTAQRDVRRGYDGHGDYGYDLRASRAAASSYRARAARTCSIPGTPDDPWGPYIREGSARYQVPEQWIREVMRQESGGRLYDSDGMLTTSSVGAMGLMQVMPQTYEMLQSRYALGPDPYEPHDNILAGTAYIRELYARYGAPNFLAAYNAGPGRLDAYLSDGDRLPAETVSYLASVAPRLGAGAPPGGATSGGAEPTDAFDADRAYAGGGMTGQEYAAHRAQANADSAFDGGGLVTPDAPTGILTGRGEPADSGVALQAQFATPVVAVAGHGGSWSIQVGAFPDSAKSRVVLALARARAGEFLAGTQLSITPVQRTVVLYRARFVGLSAQDAAAACVALSRENLDCFTVPPGS
jgi:hypothetical protein